MKSLVEIRGFLKTKRELSQEGFSRNKISRLKHESRIFSLRPGVYISSQRWNELEAWEKYMAETIALGVFSPTIVFSHQTAAMLQGLWLVGAPPSKIHIYAPKDPGEILAWQSGTPICEQILRFLNFLLD